MEKITVEYKKINQLTSEQYTELMDKDCDEITTKFKEFANIPEEENYSLGDTLIAIDNADLFGIYSMLYKERTIYYLVVNVMNEERAFSWSLYPN